MENNSYPINLKIDYSDYSDRLKTFFRIILVIPILIILSLLSNSEGYDYDLTEKIRYSAAAGIVFLPTLLMILFRQKYPRWWFDWNLALTKFSTRVFSYILLLRDEYPSTDDDQAIHIDIPYPDVKKELVNWMPLVKWFLAIPHLIILCFLYIAVIFCTILAWIIILFTANYPKKLFTFVVGVIRWTLRVSAYAILLTTDKYPPFSLKE
jgi:hypothetical protein